MAYFPTTIKITNNQLLSWMAVLVLVAYPVFASFSIVVNSSSTPINIVYRILIVLIVLLFFFKNKFLFVQRISLANHFFLIFWIIYIIRLVNDVIIDNVTVGDYGSIAILSFAIGNCFLPFIAITLGSKHICTNFLIRNFFYTALLSNILITAITIIQNNGFNLAIFLLRASIVGSDDTALVINTITISLFGEILILISAFLIKRNSLNVPEFIKYAALLLGILNLVMGASRGPMIGTILGLLFLLYAFRPNSLRIKRKSVYYYIIGIIVAILIVGKIDWNENFEAFRRITDFLANRNSTFEVKEARDFEWAAAWNQFLNHPILGDKIINDYDGFYPHNIYLEVLQSVGLVGAIPFFTGLLLALRNMLKQQKEAIPYILIPNIIAGITSGSLYFNTGFWISIALVSTVPKLRLTLQETEPTNSDDVI